MKSKKKTILEFENELSIPFATMITVTLRACSSWDLRDDKHDVYNRICVSVFVLTFYALHTKKKKKKKKRKKEKNT